MENEKKDINNDDLNEKMNENSDENSESINADTLEDKNLETEETMSDNEDMSNQDIESAFKIKMLENTIQEKEDAYLRLNAEYTNYRRRTSEEKASIGLFANEKMMSELIPVVDNMERALSSFEDKESSMYEGVDLVYKQLVETLKKLGLEEICPEIGVDFDHNFHMAVLQEASDEYESGKVTMVLQKGYKLGKKVLRAAMVKVSS
ncbi:nucleotide exchange factor GrpE [Peptostreptococcus porci]|uniref:nucleotide exchange factor GrpE n=1 Tax=Peptostreptococcus porci TaxID=2652282 RepID=UPI002A90E1D9|nr:nucleotide exchange factor GrpE [Peptostreptococcus porci]MDY5435979.1 nucleotide exchange factor GrpE [Peptostreptococcus porci]